MGGRGSERVGERMSRELLVGERCIEGGRE